VPPPKRPAVARSVRRDTIRARLISDLHQLERERDGVAQAAAALVEPDVCICRACPHCRSDTALRELCPCYRAGAALRRDNGR